MKFKNAQAALLILDVLTMTDDLDERGKNIPHNRFPREHFRARLNVLNKISKTAEYAKLNRELKKDETPTEHDLDWFKSDDLKEEDRRLIVATKYNPAEIELTDDEVAAIKFYNGQRKELPDTSIEALDIYEEIIK